MNHGEVSAPLSVRVLVVGPDQALLSRTVARLKAQGLHCTEALASSQAALRGHLLASPDVIVVIEVGGSWQPTRALLERDGAYRSGSGAGRPAPPIFVLSDGAGLQERIEALSSQASSVWDWVEIQSPDQEIAARIGRLARVGRMAAEVDDLSRRCAEMETVDRTTGLPNHRAFQEHLMREFRRAQRYGAPLSLLIADIDRFRSLNETHGHEFGDRVLLEAARGLRSLLREVDLAARYGGEEFAVLLPETDDRAALAVAGRVRTMVESLPELLGPVAGPVEPLRITASVGVATYPHEATATRVQLLSAAEAALRRAKDEGRNRVILFSATPQPGLTAAGPAQPGSGAGRSAVDQSASEGWSGGPMNR